MAQRAPATKRLTADELGLGLLLDEVGRGEARVVVERAGAPVAAIVSADDLARLTSLEREHAERMAVLAKMRAAFADLSEQRIAADVTELVAETRRERRR